MTYLHQRVAIHHADLGPELLQVVVFNGQTIPVQIALVRFPSDSVSKFAYLLNSVGFSSTVLNVYHNSGSLRRALISAHDELNLLALLIMIGVLLGVLRCLRAQVVVKSSDVRKVLFELYRVSPIQTAACSVHESHLVVDHCRPSSLTVGVDDLCAIHSQATAFSGDRESTRNSPHALSPPWSGMLLRWERVLALGESARERLLLVEGKHISAPHSWLAKHVTVLGSRYLLGSLIVASLSLYVLLLI